MRPITEGHRRLAWPRQQFRIERKTKNNPAPTGTVSKYQLVRDMGGVVSAVGIAPADGVTAEISCSV